MPLAARILDPHSCPLSEDAKPHLGGTVATGEESVRIGFQPASRMGDTATCLGAPNLIVQGEQTVLIGDRPAARQGDETAHGGKIMLGCPTVMIGSSMQASALRTDEAFCEKWDAAAIDAIARANNQPAKRKDKDKSRK